MDNLSFVVVWNQGEEPKVILATQDKPKANARFEELMSDSKLDQIKLYSGAVPTRRWSPSQAAAIVAENSAKLKQQAESEANAERNAAKAKLEAAEEAAKEAKAKLKELDKK